MILYHPLHDPYHASFRFLRLLLATDTGSMPTLSLRILDYYLLFPSEIASIQFPTHLRKWKTAFMRYNNKYFSTVSKHSVFQQLTGPQLLALRLLESTSLVSYAEQDLTKLTPNTLPHSIVAQAKSANESEPELVNLLARKLAAIDLAGPMGLKRRTGLAEYRYDIV